jgi:hypothetical protein
MRNAVRGTSKDAVAQELVGAERRNRIVFYAVELATLLEW